MTIREFLSRLDGVKSYGNYWMARCPGHDDGKASLSVSEGDGGRILLNCHAGCAAETIVAAEGLTVADLFSEPKANGNGRAIVATYDYHDEDGKLLFQAVRYNPKDFRQRRPDGNGDWTWKLEGVRRVLYRLPELIAADQAETVFLVEGEKDVDRLRAGGLVSTCSPMGAGKWRDEYAKPLAGRDVVIIPDNDQAGRDHAQVEARSLVGVASSVKMLTLSGLPEKGDVSDWLNLGGTIETLRTMAAVAPEWKPGGEEGPKSEPARVSISWADLCQMKFPPRETLLHEIERGEVVMVAAITDRGKTTFMRNVCISLATGREYLPLVKAGKPRVVYYLDFETRLPKARADITKMLGELPVSERALMANNFHLVADCRIGEMPLSLSNPKHFDIIEQDARAVGADVIVVDTVSVAFDFQDENNNAECSRVMKRLIRLAQQLNAVVIFLHHIGKAKQEEGQTAHSVHRSRGGSSLNGCSTAIINLLADPKCKEVITLECAKVKGERFEDQIFTLNKETRWFTSGGAAPKPVSAYDQVIGVFNGHPLKRAAVLEQLDGWKPATVDRYLKEGIERGDLDKLPGGTYQKIQKPQNPIPYRDDKNGVFSQGVDNAEDSLDFRDFEETDPEPYEDDYLEAIDR